MVISEKGKKLIKSFEGCRLTAYRCPSNILTIGYGHTGDVYEGQTITQEEADRLFDTDIKRYEKPVQGYNVNQNQYDALVSFCYNCGAGALEDVMTSSNVTETMAMYVRGNNREILPGLVRRRKEEINLYNSGNEKPTNKKIYIVRGGDTLSKIAKENNVTSKELVEENKIENPDLIFEGQEIKIPETRGTSPYLFLNLHPHVASWRVYRLNVAPIVGNECGKLAPAQYGGLSYIIEKNLYNDMYQIYTESFGTVKIYAPADADSTISLIKMY